MDKMYVIYCSRYFTDIDKASVLLVPGPTTEGMTLEKAINQAIILSKTIRCLLLVEFDWDGEFTTNGKIVWPPEFKDDDEVTL